MSKYFSEKMNTHNTHCPPNTVHVEVTRSRDAVEPYEGIETRRSSGQRALKAVREKPSPAKLGGHVQRGRHVSVNTALKMCV